MFIYAIILIWSMLLFGAVHTYVYTFMNISIIIAFCRYSIHWKKKSIRLIIPRLNINYLFILFSILILLYIFPLPQSLIKLLSPESATMNALAQSPMDIVHCKPLQWGTIAVTNYPVRHAWVQYMVYVLFFWGLLLVLKQKNNINNLCLFLIVIGTIESLYGLSQSFIDSGYILWVPKAFLKNRHDTCGTLINRNHFAALMSMLMLLSMAYSASQTDRQKSSTQHTSFKQKLTRFLTNEYQWNQKIIGITAASIMGLGIFFSSSRGAVIAAFPGVVVLMVALLSRKSTKKQGFVMILVGLILLISTVSIGEDRLIHRFHAIQRAMESRIRYVHSTINLIQDYAVFGVGPANFTHVFARYQSDKDQQVTITHSHNDWLQFISEMGMLGLVFLLVMISFFIWKMVYQFRKRTSPSAVCLGIAPIAIFVSISAHSLFDFPLHIPVNMLVLIAICATGFQALYVYKYKKQSKTSLEYVEIPLTFRYIVIWIMLLMMLVSMTLISTCHFIAETYCNTVPNSTLNRNQNPSKEAIQKAIFWDPGNPVHWYKLAWKHIAYRNTIASSSSEEWLYVQKQVIKALEQAVESNPCEAEYHIRLAWEYHQMQYHEVGEQKQKRIESSDIAMKHAAIVCGDKSYSQHMEIANYWNMRSATHANLVKQESFWELASRHYRKALMLSPGQRCKKSIVKQLKLYRRHERHFRDVFKNEYIKFFLK